MAKNFNIDAEWGLRLQKSLRSAYDITTSILGGMKGMGSSNEQCSCDDCDNPQMPYETVDNMMLYVNWLSYPSRPFMQLFLWLMFLLTKWMMSLLSVQKTPFLIPLIDNARWTSLH